MRFFRRSRRLRDRDVQALRLAPRAHSARFEQSSLLFFLRQLG